jgi:D-alanyl-D-alanine carboxypeptidase
MFKPARRLLAFLGAALAFTATAPSVQAQPLAGQPKYAAIVVDAKNGEVLYAKRADSPRYPASITKVMTLYLTFEALSSGKLRPDDRVVFSPRAAAQAPTKLGVPAGGSITVSEAMQAMVTKSANDAAVAMAEKLGGTESRFAAMMTLRAKELGMAETHYVNASGLPDSRQLSSARDIALLSRAVMRDYPQYYKLFSQQSFDWHGQKIMNHNRLMLRMPGVDGLKTGFTNASGFNLATSAVRDGRRLIVVVLGGPTTACA